MSLFKQDYEDDEVLEKRWGIFCKVMIVIFIALLIGNAIRYYSF